MLQHHNTYSAKAWLKLSLFLLAFFTIGQFGIQPARAATHTVCKTGGCEFSSIQAAINGSISGDVLTFPINKETYEERITLNKSLTFVGQTTAINAQAGGTAVTINGSPTVIMQNMIIQNGSGTNGGGILLNGGDLTITNSSLNNNNVSSNGGALYITSASSTVQLTDVTMQLNTAVTSGGAIYNNGTLNADDLTLTDNSATDGGGIYNNGTVFVENQSAIQRNVVSNSGGGVYNAAGRSFTFNTSDMSNNEAQSGAGIFNQGTLQATNVNLGSGNVAAQNGGGLHNSGTATLTNSAVVQNQADAGAGVYNEGGLTANNSTFSRNTGLDNQHSANGPGLYNQSGTAVLNNVTLHLTFGTSIFANGGTVEIKNSIISSALGTSGLTVCGGTGNFVSRGYNLSSDQSCTFLTQSGDLQGVDPNLNGITSPAEGAAYHTPKLTSPVVDAGNPATPGSGGNACLASDQRGLARPQSQRCDIGAVEIVVYRLYMPSVTK
ncbi:MAG: hypothetical protein H6652_23060 [Ardenticatenaceae bacterium]|nr:hypothetical protein [Ardenticatenaceae bacterium]MCB8947204.1 hypothetical protein [Ardenticatenaceae bacterium]